MARFMAIFTGSPGAGRPDEATLARGMRAWGDWMAGHAADIVETGGPFGPTKRVSRDGIADVRNNLSGYVVVEARDHDAAARMFEDHPHFRIFPGDGVDVMPLMAIPKS